VADFVRATGVRDLLPCLESSVSDFFDLPADVILLRLIEARDVGLDTLLPFMLHRAVVGALFIGIVVTSPVVLLLNAGVFLFRVDAVVAVAVLLSVALAFATLVARVVPVFLLDTRSLTPPRVVFGVFLIVERALGTPPSSECGAAFPPFEVGFTRFPFDEGFPFPVVLFIYFSDYFPSIYYELVFRVPIGDDIQICRY